MIPSRPTPERISQESSSLRGVVMRDWPGRRRSSSNWSSSRVSSSRGNAVDDAADAAPVGLAERGDAEHAAEGAAHGAHAWFG